MTYLNMNIVSKQLNNRTFTDYYNRLQLMAKSVFVWENLPDGMDEKHIEKFLFSEGCCMFFKPKDMSFIVSRCTREGLNHYDEPTKLRPVAIGIPSNDYENGTECVLIRNNDDMIPTKETIELYAYRLTELTRTQDININAVKTPVLVTGSHKQMLTLKNVYKQWDGNEPVIFGDKTLDVDALKVLRTDAPVVFDKLEIQKHALWNECMTYLGLNNANMDKRERLVADEVQANNEQVESSANMMLKAREQACEQINELFGLNIKVSLRNKPVEETIVKEGEEE